VTERVVVFGVLQHHFERQRLDPRQGWPARYLRQAAKNISRTSSGWG
jgi:hypothetical protein